MEPSRTGIATAIKKKVAELNEWLSAAANEDMFVHITVTDVTTMGDRSKRVVLSVRVYEEL